MQAQESIATVLAMQQQVSSRHVMLRRDAAEMAEPVPANLVAAFRTMFTMADVVFTGEVIDLKREQGAVVVQWRVDDAILGATAGTLCSMREWDGLWADGRARYFIGERALLMLHAPSVAGYSSPVGGMDGVIPLRGDVGSGTLDLRWLARHIVTAPERPAPASRAITLDSASERSVDSSSVMSGASSQDVTGSLDGAMMMSMLHAWQRAENVNR